MRYRLDLYEITNTTRQAILSPVLEGSWKRGLPNEDTLEFSLPMYGRQGERLYDTNDDADGSEGAVLTPQKWVRLVDIDLATSRSYVIREIKKSRGVDGEALIAVKCEGYAFKFMDKIVPLTTDFAGVTATIFLDQILVGTGLTAGTNQIPTTEKRTVHIEYPNVVEALNVITDNWDETAGGVKKRFFWRINENNTVDILREDTYGSTLAPKFTAKRNVLSLVKEVSSRKLINRLFVSTDDGGSLIESQRTWYRDTIAGTDLTATGNSDSLTLNGYGDTSNKLGVRSYVSLTVATEVVWASAGNVDFVFSVELQTSGGTRRARFEKTVNHTGSGTTQNFASDIILEVLENTDAEKLVVKFETFTINSGTVTSKRVFIPAATAYLYGIWYWTAPNVNYVDGANQATYGVVEDGFRDERLNLMAHNLVSDYKKITGTRGSPTVTSLEINSDFTGNYTNFVSVGDICNGWTLAVGGTLITASKNTDKAFIIQGYNSQKLTTTTANQEGIVHKEGFFLRKAKVYYFEITVNVVKGRVNIYLQEGSAGPKDIDFTTTGYGWLKISGFLDFISGGIPSVDGVYRWGFKLVPIDGSNAAEAYIDSIMITVAGEARPFTRQSIADDLRTVALGRVGLNESPAKTFSIDMADLGELEPGVNSAERFSPGDYIKIDDKTLNVVATLRVQQKTTDLVNPEKSRVEVELLPQRAGDLIFKALGRPELALQRS